MSSRRLFAKASEESPSTTASKASRAMGSDLGTLIGVNFIANSLGKLLGELQVADGQLRGHINSFRQSRINY